MGTKLGASRQGRGETYTQHTGVRAPGEGGGEGGKVKKVAMGPNGRIVDEKAGVTEAMKCQKGGQGGGMWGGWWGCVSEGAQRGNLNSEARQIWPKVLRVASLGAPPRPSWRLVLRRAGSCAAAFASQRLVLGLQLCLHLLQVLVCRGVGWEGGRVGGRQEGGRCTAATPCSTQQQAGPAGRPGSSQVQAPPPPRAAAHSLCANFMSRAVELVRSATDLVICLAQAGEEGAAATLSRPSSLMREM